MSNCYNIGSQMRQQVFTVILNGGAGYEELSNTFSISQSTARDHVADLISKDGVPLESRSGKSGAKEFFHEPDTKTKDHPVNPDVDTSELRSKASVTKEAKEDVHELIQHIEKDLNGRAPAEPEGGLVRRDGNEDMVCHRSDDHIGAKYTDEFGNVTCEAEIIIDRVRTVSNEVFRQKEMKEAAGKEFDTLTIVMGGDHLHGTGIHEDQPWETELPIPAQLTVAGDIYMEFIDRAQREFDSVQIVCQEGNHGELRGDGMGPEDNVDTAFFMVLDRRVRDRGYDNVRFVRSHAGNFTNFRMRVDEEADREKADALDMEVHELPNDLLSGHRAHLRHGQNSLEHIGTSAGKKRWLFWKDQHEFDIAYRGHYHMMQLDSINSKPVLMSGAVIPPSDFEESLAEWDQPAATIHGVSDDEVLSWFKPIKFNTPLPDATEPEEEVIDVAL
jgi:hypothetical protein